MAGPLWLCAHYEQEPDQSRAGMRKRRTVIGLRKCLKDIDALVDGPLAVL